MNENTREKTIWDRPGIDEMILTEQQAAFLTTCMEQNLEHARHVENERLTFNSIYMALVGGVLAFVYSTDVKNQFFAIIVTVLLIVTGFIAMNLTKRWDNTFNQHIRYAKGDYSILHKHLFPYDTDGDGVLNENERIEGLDELPAYCFRPRNPEASSGFMKAVYRIRTRRLFFWFYVLIQLVLIASLVYLIMQM